MDKRIILNSIQTPDGTVLISRHVHDYQTHLDKNGYTYGVDGGNEYLKRIMPTLEVLPWYVRLWNKITGKKEDNRNYIDLSIMSDAPFEEIRTVYCRGGRGINGDEPLTWVPLCEMNDEWLKACITYNIKRKMGDSFANEMYKKELDFRARMESANNIIEKYNSK